MELEGYEGCIHFFIIMNVWKVYAPRLILRDSEDNNQVQSLSVTILKCHNVIYIFIYSCSTVVTSRLEMEF